MSTDSLAGLTMPGDRRPRGPLPWIALAVGVLALADLAVISAVWLSLDAGDAPRTYALSWFPGVLLDPTVLLPMGTDTIGDPVNGIVLDAVEFLPQGLIITSAFALAYIYTTAARTIGLEHPTSTGLNATADVAAGPSGPAPGVAHGDPGAAAGGQPARLILLPRPRRNRPQPWSASRLAA